MTPHIEAAPGDYAPVALLPGDPQRAQWIAETFLNSPRCVNRFRGALGFTGTYQGMPVSVQATGMGRPSLSIYLNELVTVYGVKTVIRTGTCGGLQEHVSIRDLFIAQTAIMEEYLGSLEKAERPDAALLRIVASKAAASGVRAHFGDMLCSDVFYHPRPEGRFDPARSAGITAVDMETSALFSISALLQARALSICTVVDNPISGQETAMSERQDLFAPMARLALDVALSSA